MSTSPYTAYIIHVPMIVGLRLLLKETSIDPVLNFERVVISSVVLTFTVNEYLVKRILSAEQVLQHVCH